MYAVPVLVRVSPHRRSEFLIRSIRSSGPTGDGSHEKAHPLPCVLDLAIVRANHEANRIARFQEIHDDTLRTFRRWTTQLVVGQRPKREDDAINHVPDRAWRQEGAWMDPRGDRDAPNAPAPTLDARSRCTSLAANGPRAD
jgi:hypothetical protein